MAALDHSFYSPLTPIVKIEVRGLLVLLFGPCSGLITLNVFGGLTPCGLAERPEFYLHNMRPP
jgi:hypothetical protein